MQGAALHVYRADQFPDFAFGETVATRYQAGLLPDADDEPATKLTHQGLSDHAEFERFLCEHQEIRAVEAVWRRQPISSLIVKSRFNVFRHKQRRDLLIARGNRRIVGAAMRRLNSSNFDIKFDTVDIQTLTRALKARRATLHAAYFADLTLRKVKAATLYGEDVDESVEYEHLDQAGILSAVMLETALEGIPHKFLVTHRRTVVVYNHKDEQPQLDLGLKVNALIEEVLPPARAPRNA